MAGFSSSEHLMTDLKAREQTCGCQGGKEAVWGQPVQTSVCGTDEDPGPPVQHRDLCSGARDKP